MAKEENKPHYYEPIDEAKPLHGNNRNAYLSSAPPEVQQKVVDIIIEEARKRRFNNRDIAYYIAIAKRESSFNPDAASRSSSASGIAQVINDTGKDYGINNSNRFDARASIIAGLSYFSDLKKQTIIDYGTATGEAEVMIYYGYHYGEYSYLRPKNNIENTRAKRLKPLSDLIDTAKYKDSKTVVDEAARIERLLNDSHGLTIQLTDIWGKDMSGRKVIVVTKQAKSTKVTPLTEKTVSLPLVAKTTATTSSTIQSPTSQTIPEETPKEPTAENSQATAEENPANNGELPEIAPYDDEPLPSLDAPIEENASTENDYELVAKEYVTDSNGQIPEIETNQASPVLVLVPRMFHEEYSDAVAEGTIPEVGNNHQTLMHESPAFHPPIPTAPPSKPVKQTAVKPIEQKPSTSTSTTQATALKPSRGHNISFEDAALALKKIGWVNVYSTAFTYIKQFYTKPKLNQTPLDNNPVTKGSAPVKTIASSLKNSEVKKNQAKADVTTKQVTAVKVIEFTGETPWMDIALAEQSKSGDNKVTVVSGTHRSDAEWKDAYKERKTAENTIKKLKSEKVKSEKEKNLTKTKELETQINDQLTKLNEADKKMLAIESKYNNQDIVKYLQSTTLDKDSARDESTSWCSAFLNWCITQSGYKGTNDAGAISWKNWGEELSEPRYGAITVVTRAENPVKYHVGFFLGIQSKNIPDGEEEIEIKNKKGEIVKKLKKKYKKVDHVRLLSGNMSQSIRDLAMWTVSADDNPASHLVSYRWPKASDKK